MADSNSPLYLHPSDHPGMQLVTNVFGGSGFASWKRSIFIALSAKNKLGFITGKCEKPDETAPDVLNWERCNDMVISWILNALEKDIANSVLYNTTAQEIWTELEHRFGQSNGAQLYNLQKEICSLNQGNMDVSTYFTKAKCLWDEMSAVEFMPICTCGSAEAISKRLQDQRLIQFLMGLNDSFRTVRGNILMMSPLPSFAQVYSLLMQEEQQQENSKHSPVGEISNSMSFNAKGYRVASRNSKPNFDGRKPSYFCNHCKRSGHTEDRCWKKNGYPKGNDKRKMAAVALDNNIDGMAYESEGRVENDPMADLTSEQRNQLVKLLNEIQLQNLKQNDKVCLPNCLDS